MIDGGNLDDGGGAVRLRAQHDALVAGDDGERSLGRQHRASDHAQTVAERARWGGRSSLDERIGRLMLNSSAISSGVPSRPGPSSAT